MPNSLDNLYSTHLSTPATNCAQGLSWRKHRRNISPQIVGTLGIGSTAKWAPRGLTASSIPTSSVPTTAKAAKQLSWWASLSLHKVSENTASGSAWFMYSMRDDEHVYIEDPVPCVRFAERQETSCCTVAYGTYRWLSLVAS
jgi:hypothetical protein